MCFISEKKKVELYVMLHVKLIFCFSFQTLNMSLRLIDLCLFGFVGFLFLLMSGKGCGYSFNGKRKRLIGTYFCVVFLILSVYLYV